LNKKSEDTIEQLFMKKNFYVIGISYGSHDTSAALGVNGKIIAACEQERYDNLKHSRNFPLEAINDCLKIGKIKIKDIDQIALGFDYDELIKKQYLEGALQSKEKLNNLINQIETIKLLNNIHNIIRLKLNFTKSIVNFKHHLCHVASAFYSSGFKESLLFSNDGVGEFQSGMIASGVNNKIKILELGPNFPNSLGLVYAAVTHFLGWKYNCDEGIVMGLAPFGNPNTRLKNKKKIIDIFRDIILYKRGFDFEINKKYITYHLERDTWVSDYFKNIFSKKNYSSSQRVPNTKILSGHKDIAAALQLRIEEVVLEILNYAKKKYKFKNLCVAGGVALNCSLNGKILKKNLFDKIFIQPAAGDSGISLGAAYLAMQNNKPDNAKKEKFSCYLGPEFNKSTVRNILKLKKVKFHLSKNIFYETARFLKDGKIVGWFQGREEIGPRALGNRSILCRPYPLKMKDYLNSKVKFREKFRPFAPAVLQEDYKRFFYLNQDSPHMLIACKIRPFIIKKIPAVVHIDKTSRVQTVSELDNSKFYNLIKEFKKLTGCPVLLNTSFNIKGQTVVNSCEKAIDTFYKTKIDVLVIDDYIVEK
jgi:carbamoyltransferase